MSKHGWAKVVLAGAAIIALAGCTGVGTATAPDVPGETGRSTSTGATAPASSTAPGASARQSASSVTGARQNADLAIVREGQLDPVPRRGRQHVGVPDHDQRPERPDDQQDHLGRAGAGRVSSRDGLDHRHRRDGLLHPGRLLLLPGRNDRLPGALGQRRVGGERHDRLAGRRRPGVRPGLPLGAAHPGQPDRPGRERGRHRPGRGHDVRQRSGRHLPGQCRGHDDRRAGGRQHHDRGPSGSRRASAR